MNRIEFFCVRLAVLVCNCRVYQWQQIAAITQRVFQWIETADQERGDAQTVVLDQRFRHLFGRADQRRGIARRFSCPPL